MVVLDLASGSELDTRTDAIAIALRSFKRKLEPMTVAGAVIDPDFSGSTESGHDKIEFAVAIEIGGRGR